MKMDLPISVVSDIVFDLSRRLFECSARSRPIAARTIRLFIGAVPSEMRGDIKSHFRDAVAHYRSFKGVR